MMTDERGAGLRDKAAIVGVGNTNYAAPRAPDPTRTSYRLGAEAFQAALDDAGLRKSEIDGLCAGGPVAHERLSELLGLNPSWGISGDAPRCIVEAVQAIDAGLCTTVALVYGNAQRSVNTQYGGPQAMGGESILSYVYYAPWGMTSQGALYAMMFKRHQLVYGTNEEQLAAVSIAFRRHASLNPNAVMQTPITKEDYLAARYIVEPLRLYD